MKEFTIKAAERLSGIKAHTLRVWEQRYGILQPTRRKDSNHRVYTNNEIKSLLRIAFLYNQGYKISDIARLKQEEVEQLIQSANNDKASIDLFFIALKEAIIDFDDEAFEGRVERLIIQLGMKDALLKVIFPFLNQIGLLWLTDKLIPVQEHFASNIIIRKLIKAQDEVSFNPVRRSGTVMLLTPEGEYHEIALLFFRYLLMINGFSTIYLGTSASFAVVEQYYEKHKPTHLLLHFTSNLQAQEIPEYITNLKNICPFSKVVVSGAALQQYANELDGVKHLKDEKEMLDFCSDIFA
jgi:MerR family transcriptional regulator, light-induced transcriptional regulator